MQSYLHELAELDDFVTRNRQEQLYASRSIDSVRETHTSSIRPGQLSLAATLEEPTRNFQKAEREGVYGSEEHPSLGYFGNDGKYEDLAVAIRSLEEHDALLKSDLFIV